MLASDRVAEWPEGALFAAGDVEVLVHERAAGMDDGPPGEDHVAVGITDLDATGLRVGDGVGMPARPDGRLVEASAL